jgi:SAM-dependent methyltransferase
MDKKKYMGMQKAYYEFRHPDSKNISSERMVGNYEWHENFPYETQLLYKNGDLRMPLVINADKKIALDFGCGPGRMIKRMSKLFNRVDGVDISSVLIKEAKQVCPQSNFYISSGNNLGEAPANTYDFVYSTITIQHIAVHEIRMDIFKGIYKVLKPGGSMTIQMAFHPEYPFTRKGELATRWFKLRLLQKDEQHARWNENRIDVTTTNSGCDVYINNDSLPMVKADVGSIFKNVDYWFYDVSLIYENLNGAIHGSGYWPTHWIFIYGQK